MPNELAIDVVFADPKTDVVTYTDKFAQACARIVGSDSIQDGYLVSLVCFHERISPLEFAKLYHVIKGRPTMRADAMLARARQAGFSHKIIERTPKRAAMELTYPDGTTYFDELTWEAAQKAQWPWTDKSRTKLKDNWNGELAVKVMLWARLISSMIRAAAPELVYGIYTPEEAEDFDVGQVETKQITSNVSPLEFAAKVAAEAKQSPKDVVDDDAEIVEAEEQQSDVSPDGAPSNSESHADSSSDRDALEKELSQIFDQLGANEEQRGVVISKRGAKSIGDLSDEVIREMVEKGREKVRNLKKTS